jgi:hypothetical protein
LVVVMGIVLVVLLVVVLRRGRTRAGSRLRVVQVPRRRTPRNPTTRKKPSERQWLETLTNSVRVG